MSQPRKEKRVQVDRPQFPEPSDTGGFELYLLEKGVEHYVPGCVCYAYNANRQYFVEHWSTTPVANGGAE
jgi:hypothetical protein